jgi:hypothetical protein
VALTRRTDEEAASQTLAAAGIPPEDLQSASELAVSLAEAPVRVYDTNRRVTAYDQSTGEKLPHKVPRSHLDGRFANLRETPSSKAGKS